MTEPTRTRIHLHLTATQVLTGAAPAITGVVLGLMHFRDPIISIERQGVLLVVIISLIGASFFLWLLFAASSIARDFQDRHDELQEAIAAIRDLIDAHARASERDFRAAMHRLHKACKKSDQASTEVEQLKKIILDGTDWPRQDLP